MAAGSVTESAAICDVCLRLKLIDLALHGSAKEMLDRIMAMLVGLAKGLQ